MICSVHGCEMEWISLIDDPMIGDGYWFCEVCHDEEEEEFEQDEEE